MENKREKIDLREFMAESHDLYDDLLYALDHGTVEDVRNALRGLYGRRAVAPKRRDAQQRRLSRLRGALTE